MNSSRRRWLKSSAFCASAFAFGRLGARQASALEAPDPLGVRVPPNFRARLLARSGAPVTPLDFSWHAYPDGGATFPARNGWVYVSNAEVPDQRGGASALRFDADGNIVDAYRILAGTSRNCAGGATPWNTWLSCEEVAEGIVFECNPYRAGQGVPRAALGRFSHEAAAIDPQTGAVYLTEDDVDGRFYRFRPRSKGRLDAGALEAAHVAADGAVSWTAVAPEEPYRGEDSTPFARGEGAWYADHRVYFTTTEDHRVWMYDVSNERLRVIYDAAAREGSALLRDPDNITAHPVTGALFVAEDWDDMQVVMLAWRGDRWHTVPIVQFIGHDGSEVTGPAFSADGTRLYVSSQRGRDGEHGMTFEIAGPFSSL